MKRSLVVFLMVFLIGCGGIVSTPTSTPVLVSIPTSTPTPTIVPTPTPSVDDLLRPYRDVDHDFVLAENTCPNNPGSVAEETCNPYAIIAALLNIKNFNEGHEMRYDHMLSITSGPAAREYGIDMADYYEKTFQQFSVAQTTPPCFVEVWDAYKDLLRLFADAFTAYSEYRDEEAIMLSFAASDLLGRANNEVDTFLLGLLCQPYVVEYLDPGDTNDIYDLINTLISRE